MGKEGKSAGSKTRRPAEVSAEVADVPDIDEKRVRPRSRPEKSAHRDEDADAAPLEHDVKRKKRKLAKVSAHAEEEEEEVPATHEETATTHARERSQSRTDGVDAASDKHSKAQEHERKAAKKSSKRADAAAAASAAHEDAGEPAHTCAGKHTRAGAAIFSRDDHTADDLDAPLDDDAGDGDATARTVYMEGIPYTCTEDDIREFFCVPASGKAASSSKKSAAPSSDVLADAIVSLRAPTYHDSGKLRGYAHVEFRTRGAATAAIALSGRSMTPAAHAMGGGDAGRSPGDARPRMIRIAQAKPPAHGASALALSTKPRPAGCTTLFVKGLPYEADEAVVKEAFSSFGRVTDVRLPMWSHTHRRKGIGYVSFEHGFAAEAAMNAFRGAASGGPPVRVGVRPVELDYDTRPPRMGFKAPTGQAWHRTEEGKALKAHAPRRT